jgi:hypothetical protein
MAREAQVVSSGDVRRKERVFIKGRMCSPVFRDYFYLW